MALEWEWLSTKPFTGVTQESLPITLGPDSVVLLLVEESKESLGLDSFSLAPRSQGLVPESRILALALEESQAGGMRTAGDESPST